MADSFLRSSTTFRLGLTGVRWERRYAERLQRLGIGPKHVALLALLRSGSAGTQQQLARSMSVVPSFVVALTDHLVGLGAVERVRDAQDRRRQRLVLTESGHLLLRDAEAALARLDAELLQILGPARQGLHEALSALTAHELEPSDAP